MNTRSSFFAATLLALFSNGSHAQDGPPPGWVGPPPGWSGGVIAGAARAPDFEGSRHSRTQPVLGAEITYRSANWGSVAMGSRGLNWTVLQNPELSAGVGVSADPGRVDNGDRKLTAVGYRPGSETLRGMGEIDRTSVLSATGSYTLFDGLALTGALHHAATSYRGNTADAGLSLPWKMGAHAQLTIAPSITWADRRTMRAYFGVSPEQSAASGYAVFDANAGLKSAQLQLEFDMALSRYWHINANLLAKRLKGDAADSPIVQKTMQVSGLLGVMYQFQL